MAEKKTPDVQEEKPIEELKAPEEEEVVGGLNPQPDPPRAWAPTRINPISPVITRIPR